MRNTQKSLANEYGITQKNLSQNPSMGIGLNPNLNIEDEYIENLLKQIHFLSMEIKLVKEKQKENKGMGIMGLLNKDQNPVVSHAIASNAKFSEMKTQLAEMVNNATAQSMRLDDENFAIKAQREFLEKLSLKEEQKNIENRMYVEKEISEGIDKLRNGQKKLQQLREENDKVTEIHKRLSFDWQKMTTEQKTKNLIKKVNQNLSDESHGLRQKHLTANSEIFNKHNDRLQQASKLYHEDINYIELVEESKELKEKVKKSGKQLFQLNYKVKEMQELKKLSIKNRDSEQDLKKQASEECERMKKKLGDKKNDMQSRLKDGKLSLDTNDEVRLIKGKIARKDKEISDVRRRTDASEGNFKKMRDEVMKLQDSLAIRKHKNEILEKDVHELTAIQNQTDVDLKKTELDFEKAEAELKSSDANLKDARTRIQSLEEESSYLSAKQQHLQKSVDLDEEMKKVKIEQLTVLAQSNSGLNSTIGDIMQKWEQIIRFSREPPA